MILKHWPGRTITEAADHLFCLLIGNHHPLHLDSNYAATTQFGRPVVVGNLVFETIFGMSVSDVSGKALANLAIRSIEFLNPTFHGDTVYAHTEVLKKRHSTSKLDRGIVEVRTTGTNQRAEKVCVFERAVMVPCRNGL
ncbi:hypothetical protein A3A38_03085 [Candidatus Kaiserbacteria bacterium RIFCSPLOWO2_01_FULL_53_17]|uniref:MaoC-like domain-containing protein n=1 Tax=Candidatus Kaiserbacteria bacterium RIFCSPLOWO2_01_FULL_53_17 TaxID=1798511 RepID=A0A1F6EGK8_9BACT|nr:MAG: hypothetical protein A3A38_03085 [Candidatus Kaiserbacteria bacterium RIFCSPLOWO2_01_FULL_53_17]